MSSSGDSRPSARRHRSRGGRKSPARARRDEQRSDFHSEVHRRRILTQQCVASSGRRSNTDCRICSTVSSVQGPRCPPASSRYSHAFAAPSLHSHRETPAPRPSRPLSPKEPHLDDLHFARIDAPARSSRRRAPPSPRRHLYSRGPPRRAKYAGRGLLASDCDASRARPGSAASTAPPSRRSGHDPAIACACTAPGACRLR